MDSREQHEIPKVSCGKILVGRVVKVGIGYEKSKRKFWKRRGSRRLTLADVIVNKDDPRLVYCLLLTSILLPYLQYTVQFVPFVLANKVNIIISGRR